MIAVIVAIQSEFDAIQQLLSEKKEIICKDVSYTTGKISNKEIVLAICGVGKVAAAICCCRLLENFEIDYVVNIGTAGGIKEYENIGDVMVADKLTYHDYDTSAFDNYSIGFAQNPYVFSSDEKLVKKASSLLNDGLHQVFVGPLVSGVCFVRDSEKVSFIQKYYPEALACEMEGCAIAQVCDSYHYPFIVIRSFSDIVIKKGNELDFDKYKELASKRAADFLFKLCQID